MLDSENESLPFINLDSESDNLSDTEEYFIDTNTIPFYSLTNDTEKQAVLFFGQLKYFKLKICKGNLLDLLNGKNNKCKQILNSIVKNIVECNDEFSLKCLLEKKYDIHTLNENCQSIIHLAFYENRENIFNIVCMNSSKHNYKLDGTNIKDCNGLTYLHVACAFGYWDDVQHHLKNHEYINARFCYKDHRFGCGFTPLHIAVTRNNCEEIVKGLIDNGADVNAQDDFGRTPLHLVCSLATWFSDNKESYYDEEEEAYMKKEMIEAKMKVMKLLVECGRTNIDITDNEGNTALFVIFTPIWYDDNSKILFSGCFEEAKQKFEYLLGCGSNIMHKNNNDNTLLHQVVQSLKFLRRPYLQKYDCEFDYSKHIEILKMILAADNKIDVEAENKNDETPLQIAVSYLSIDVVQLLLDNYKTSYDAVFKSINSTFRSKSMRNLFAILKLLHRNEKFILCFDDNLTIMKFLSSNIENYYNIDINIDRNKVHLDILHMMCLDFSEYVEFNLDRFPVTFDNSLSEEEIFDLMSLFTLLQRHLFCLQIGNVYFNRRTKDKLKSTLRKLNGEYRYYLEDLPRLKNQDVRAKIRKEYETLKSISLNIGSTEVNLQDALMNPHKYSRCFVNSYYDENCISNLVFYKHIVDGFTIKFIIQYYVNNHAYKVLSKLYKGRTDDLPNKIIAGYLSLQDIFNVYKALRFL